MIQNNKILDGKIAVVTGAGRGIGKAIAIGLGDAGAAVCCVGRTKQPLMETVDLLEEHGSTGWVVCADVTDLKAVEKMFARVVAEMGTIDILVLNAGGPVERNMVENSNPQSWVDTITLNLYGAYYCVRSAIPHMKEKGGTIITLGSGRGHRPKAGTSAYACAKAGLWMLTRVLAEELAPYNITINELIPGPVMTEGFQQALAGVDLRQAFPDVEWIKQPQDVVPMAIFLASQPLTGPTGQCFSLMRRDGL